MASTINSNTSSGVVVTSDTSGVLQLQTASTTAVTIDASQNVGVGTTTPDIFSRGYGRILGISESGNSGSAVQINSGASSYPALEMGRGGVRKFVIDAQSTKLEIASLEAVPMTFLTNSAEAMRLDSSGNLGIGTTSPSSTLDVNGNGSISGNLTVGVRNRITSTNRVSVSTSATTIYSILTGGSSVGTSAVILLVNGYDTSTNTNSFADVVVYIQGVAPTVISSTNRGSAVARTYSASGANLQLRMASGTYNVANSSTEQAC